MGKKKMVLQKKPVINKNQEKKVLQLKKTSIKATQILQKARNPNVQK